METIYYHTQHVHRHNKRAAAITFDKQPTPDPLAHPVALARVFLHRISETLGEAP